MLKNILILCCHTAQILLPKVMIWIQQRKGMFLKCSCLILHNYFMQDFGPPTTLSIDCARKLSLHHDPIKVKCFILTGLEKAMKLSLRCRNCTTTVNMAMWNMDITTTVNKGSLLKHQMLHTLIGTCAVYWLLLREYFVFDIK